MDRRLGRYLVVASILMSGFALKGVLLSTDTVSFDSDEAVVALMAKHILAGERPVFFYGQAYMGSLDAYMIALAYRLLGVRLFTVRLVQLVLFMGLVLATYHLVRRLYGDETTAQIAALLVAIPPPLVGLYTTVTLGGYGETLLFGTCLLLIGHAVTHRAEESWLLWALLGLLAGLAFWTLPLAVVYIIPVALAILHKGKWRLGARYGLALAAFLLGSSPWWGYCVGHGDACLKPFAESPGQLLTPVSWLSAIGYRVFAFLFLGLPALWGMRNPWSPTYAVSILAVAMLAFYLGSVAYALRARNHKHFLPLALGGVFMVIFLGTSFGNDGTGRYLLPLYLLVAILAAELIRAMKARSHWLAAAALGCVMAFNLGATISASFTEPAGMTTQLDGRLQFGNRYDTELLTFLKQQGESYGYGNYWVAYKITFLSDEEVVIAPRLPYKADLSDAQGQDRYPSYSLWVDRSTEPPFYATSNQPELDERLRDALDARQIDYKEKMIGAYHVFYGLSVSVTPEELDLSAER